MNEAEAKKLRAIVDAVRKVTPPKSVVVDKDLEGIYVATTFVRSKKLSSKAKIVYQLFKTYYAEIGRERDTDGKPVLPSQKDMAVDAGMSRATFQRALVELVVADKLVIHRKNGLGRKGEGHNVYVLAPCFYEVKG